MAEPKLCNQHKNFIYQGPSCVICATDRTVDAGIQIRAETYTQQELDAVMATQNEHCDERIATAQSTLARELLAAVEALKRKDVLGEIEIAHNIAIDDVMFTFRAKCAELGVDI